MSKLTLNQMWVACFLYLKLGRSTWIFWFIVLKLSHYLLWFQILTTITFTEIFPSTKTIASFKLPDYNSGKVSEFLFARVSNQFFTCKFKLKAFSDRLSTFLQVEVQYFHDHATFTTAVALNQSPVVDLSATIGTPTIAFGAEAGYDTTSGSFTKYTAGVSVTKPDSYASILL